MFADPVYQLATRARPLTVRIYSFIFLGMAYYSGTLVDVDRETETVYIDDDLDDRERGFYQAIAPMTALLYLLFVPLLLMQVPVPAWPLWPLELLVLLILLPVALDLVNIAITWRIETTRDPPDGL